MEERRKHNRINVSFPVECNPLTEKNYFYTVSKDLSLGGVKILASDFLPKGNLFRLNINLIDRLVDVKAKVAWCNKERISDRYSVGLEFVEASEDNQKSLCDFLNKTYKS
jgi:c-di-GMP-binding flagellar brake protein YcgR